MNDDIFSDVGYCGLVAVKIENGKKTLIQDGSNKHLNII